MNSMHIVKGAIFSLEVSKVSKVSYLSRFHNQKVSKWHWLIFSPFGALAYSTLYFFCRKLLNLSALVLYLLPVKKVLFLALNSMKRPQHKQLATYILPISIILHLCPQICIDSQSQIIVSCL